MKEIDWDKVIANAKTSEEWEQWRKEHKIRTFFDNIIFPFSIFHMKFKLVYYEIKYAFQRMFRGYGDDETFSIDYAFLDKYTKILKQFRTYEHSYPSQFDSYDDWAKVLDEMISYFELSDDHHTAYCQDDFEYNYADFKYNEQLAFYYKHKALDVFIKYFDDLWD